MNGGNCDALRRQRQLWEFKVTTHPGLNFLTIMTKTNTIRTFLVVLDICAILPNSVRNRFLFCEKIMISFTFPKDRINLVFKHDTPFLNVITVVKGGFRNLLGRFLFGDFQKLAAVNLNTHLALAIFHAPVIRLLLCQITTRQKEL